MIGSAEAQGTTVTTLIQPKSATNTAGATSSWIDISGYEGYLVFTQMVGVVTEGSITGKIQDADNSNGDNPSDVSGAGFVAVDTDNDAPNIQRVCVNTAPIRNFIRYLGTVATGPALVAVSMLGTKKLVE